MFSKAFSKVSDLSEKAANAAKSSATVQHISAQVADEHCTKCGRVVTILQKASAQARIHSCRVCSKKFCGDCTRKSPQAIPVSLWSQQIPRPDDGIGYLCVPECYDRCVQQWVLELADCIRVPFEANTNDFVEGLASGYATKCYYDRPVALEDSRRRQAVRIAILAARVADAVGYSTYVKLAKAAFTGGFGVQMFLSGDQYKMFVPLYETFMSLGIMGPNGLLQLYYLSCWHMIQRSQNPSIDRILHSHGVPGVIQNVCPLHYLKDVYSNAYAAQCLYESTLPSPHDEVEWSNWYLGRIVHRESWTVIGASSQTTELPNGVNCPAFALLARILEGKREAMLVVRGTASPVDWKINLKDNAIPFVYHEGPLGDIDISGKAHDGMLNGARAILDCYGVRCMVYRLMAVGFTVKTVGHSLGGSTSMFLAAELSNGLVEIRRHLATPDGAGGPPNGHNIWVETPITASSQSATAWLRDSRLPIPKVHCYAFGMPPCVSPDIADAMRRDCLVVTVVNCDDGVPRFSRVNVLKLAMELRTTDAPTEQWKLEDQATVTRYMETYGKAQDFIPEEKKAKLAEEHEVSSKPSAAGEEESPIVSAKELTPAEREKEETFLSKRAEEMAMLRKRLDESTDLVLPGNIIHLYRDNGILSASLVDHQFAAFRELKLYMGLAEDHAMHRYRLSLGDAIRWQERIASTSEKTSAEPVLASPPEWQMGIDSDGKWRVCSVCECDPTWACITRSDASRSTVTHNCRMCGCIVCSVCSPSGDQIPGDGVGTFETLADNRIPLPSIGLYSPQRVCLPCYLSNSH